MVKLVASDIDGTLLRGGATKIPEEVFVQIRRLKEKGIPFAAASGRQYKSLRQLFAPVADDIYYLCENGAIVFGEGKVLAKLPMPRKEAEELIAQIQGDDDCEVLISGANTSYLMPKHEDYYNHIRYFVGNNVMRIGNVAEIKEDILKVSAYCRSGPESYDKTLGNKWRDRFSVALAGGKWLDLMLADKSTGMKALCRCLDINLADVAAFGDNFNDMPMLEAVGQPYILAGSVLDRAGYGREPEASGKENADGKAGGERRGGKTGVSGRFFRVESVESVMKGW